MSVLNPKQLVDEFKKSGEFDRLRRELFTQFQCSVRIQSLNCHSLTMSPHLSQDRITGFKSRVDDIAHQRLASDHKLIHMSHDTVVRELMGEIDRYPIVERAVAEAPLLSETSFVAAIRTSLQRILDEDRGRSTPSSTDPPNANSGGSHKAEQSPSRATRPLPNGDIANSHPR
ncbi:hypothetical protein V8B97DRAFT_143796 [Scleroderma yunnanense]